MVYTFCRWCAGQRGHLLRGAPWVLAKLGQKLQLKCGWWASLHWCDNSQEGWDQRVSAPCKTLTETPPAVERDVGMGEEKPLPMPRLGHYHHCCVCAANGHTGKRSLQDLTHNAISVTDFGQEQLRISCVCHILFLSPFPASAAVLAATCEAAPLGRGVCLHRG